MEFTFDVIIDKIYDSFNSVITGVSLIVDVQPFRVASITINIKSDRY